MPSTKDPSTVVQPGPGILPAGVVPASALLFIPGGTGSLASEVSYAGDGPWVDGTLNPGTDVGSQLTKIITDLTNDSGGSNSSPHSGADRVSARTTLATFAAGGTLTAASVQALIEAVITALATAATNPAGSDRIGARTSTATFADSSTITGASAQALVEAILTALTSTTVSHAGSDRVAARTTTATFADSYHPTGATVQALIENLISYLASTSGTGGTTAMGAGAVSGLPFSLTSGELVSQLGKLLSYINQDYQARTLGSNWTIDQGGPFTDNTIILTAPLTLTLPTHPVTPGRRLYLIDQSGSLSIGTPVTIHGVSGGSGDSIDGIEADYQLTTPYGRWVLTTDGGVPGPLTNWYLFSC